MKLDEVQKAAALAQAEADKANAEAARLEAEAKKASAREVYDEAIIEQNKKAANGTLIYEDTYVCIRFIGAEKSSSWYEYDIVFLVENKTNVELTIQCSSLAFDGIAVDGTLSCSDKIPPQSLSKVRVRCDSIPLSNPSFISGKLTIIDFDRTLFNQSFSFTFINVNVQ